MVDGEPGGAASVLDNDGGACDSFRAALVTEPQHGTLEFQADGTFVYTPNPNFHGVDTFTYAVERARAVSRG